MRGEALDTVVSPALRRRAWLRPLVIFAGLLAAILVAQLTPIHDRLGDVSGWKSWLESTGGWARLVFVASTALLVAVGTPRLILSFVGGMVFGVAEGLLWSLLGSLAGAYMLFVVSRWAGRAWMQRRVAGHPRMSRLALASPTIWGVALVRQAPAPGFLTTVMLAMTPMRHGAFSIGSLIGYVPGALAAALCGSGVISASLSHAIPRVAAALGVVLLMGWAAARLYGRPVGGLAANGATEDHREDARESAPPV